jgi:hypothetical protein
VFRPRRHHRRGRPRLPWAIILGRWSSNPMLSNGVSTFLDSSHRGSPTIAKRLRGADDLRKLLLFDGLTDEQLMQVCSNARIQV